MIGLGASIVQTNRRRAVSAPVAYTTGAVVFDGTVSLTNDTLTIPASAVGLISLWYNYSAFTGSSGVNFHITDETGEYWEVLLSFGPSGNGDVFASFFDAATNTLYFAFHSNTILPRTGWHNVLLSVDTNHGIGAKVGRIYLDGAAQVVTVNSDLSVAFTIGWGVGGESSQISQPTNIIHGYLADVWPGCGQILDLTSPANVARFIIDGKPVDLGADGSLPTGTAPPVFLRRAPAGSAASFAANLGTGGAYTISGGSLTNAPSSPTD